MATQSQIIDWPRMKRYLEMLIQVMSLPLQLAHSSGRASLVELWHMLAQFIPRVRRVVVFVMAAVMIWSCRLWTQLQLRSQRQKETAPPIAIISSFSECWRGTLSSPSLTKELWRHQRQQRQDATATYSLLDIELICYIYAPPPSLSRALWATQKHSLSIMSLICG